MVPFNSKEKIIIRAFIQDSIKQKHQKKKKNVRVLRNKKVLLVKITWMS